MRIATRNGRKLPRERRRVSDRRMKRVLAVLVIGALGGSAMAAPEAAPKPAKAHHHEAAKADHHKAKKAKKARKAKVKKHHAAKATKATPKAPTTPTTPTTTKT